MNGSPAFEAEELSDDHVVARVSDFIRNIHGGEPILSPNQVFITRWGKTLSRAGVIPTGACGIASHDVSRLGRYSSQARPHILCAILNPVLKLTFFGVGLYVMNVHREPS
jgi:hypothetical protein